MAFKYYGKAKLIRVVENILKIDSNRKITFIETPFDEQIEACDMRLNKIYIGYGSWAA
ncbi:MAG: hypothetical protein J0I84_04385 [Terrimonas sp.]|nr:hypothetical protein [Terrimonas sp.]